MFVFEIEEIGSCKNIPKRITSRFTSSGGPYSISVDGGACVRFLETKCNPSMTWNDLENYLEVPKESPQFYVTEITKLVSVATVECPSLRKTPTDDDKDEPSNIQGASYNVSNVIIFSKANFTGRYN